MDKKDPNKVEFGHLEITADRKLKFGISLKTSSDVLALANEIVRGRHHFIELRNQMCAELSWLPQALRDTDLEGTLDLRYSPESGA